SYLPAADRLHFPLPPSRRRFLNSNRPPPHQPTPATLPFRRQAHRPLTPASRRSNPADSSRLWHRSTDDKESIGPNGSQIGARMREK
ncbi:hypothetical protein LINPERPRIM_LOCUS26460, partial [Linum perenne]